MCLRDAKNTILTICAAVLVMFAGVAPNRLCADGRPGVNIMQNGSFEVGLKNWHSYAQGTSNPVHSRIYLKDPQLQRAPAEDAPDGKFVGVLDLPDESICFVSSRPYRVSAGSIRLTASLCGAPNARISLVDYGKLANNTIASQEVEGSSSWKTVSVEASLDEGVQHVCVSIVAYGPGTLRMDDFRLYADNALAYPVDVAIEPIVPDGVYTRGQTLEFVARAYSSDAAEGSIEYRVRNAWNEEVDQGTIELPLRANSPSEKRFELNITDTGHYHILAQYKAADKAVSSITETLFAIVPARQPLKGEAAARSRFGCNTEERPHLMALAQKIGISWVMCAPPIFTKWICVEPRRGQWNFNDETVNAMLDAGLQLVGNLADPPIWAVEPGSEAWSGPWQNPRFPADWADWDNYVRTVVSHYKGRIDHWAVWNEPNHTGYLELEQGENWVDKYMPLLERSYRIVKETNPNAVVVGGTVTNPGALPPLILAGGWKYMDVGAFHWASWVPKGYLRLTGEEMGYFDFNYVNCIEHVTEAMDKVGKRFPMWNTECHITEADYEGAYTTMPNPAKMYETPRMTRLDSAAAIPRQFVVEWAAGIDKTFFWLLGFKRNPWDSNTCTNLVDWDRSPAPALVTFAVMTSLLKDAEFVSYDKETDENLLDRPTYYTFYFKTPEGRLRVVWATSDVPHERIFQVRGDRVRVLDMFGVECAGAKSMSAVDLKDAVMLRLARYPYYILDEN